MVILAGPGVNLLIAFAVFWAIIASGSLNGDYTLENLNTSIHTLVPSATVAGIEKGEPAQGVLRLGDRILAVDGRRASVNSTIETVNSHRCAGPQVNGCVAATPVTLKIRRAGKDLTLSIRPHYDKALGRMLIGFDFGAAPQAGGCARRGGSRRARDVGYEHQHGLEHRQGVHELEGSQAAAAASSGSPRSRTKRSSPARATRSCSAGSSR